jgi:hypothetical protein
MFVHNNDWLSMDYIALYARTENSCITKWFLWVMMGLEKIELEYLFVVVSTLDNSNQNTANLI